MLSDHPDLIERLAKAGFTVTRLPPDLTQVEWSRKMWNTVRRHWNRSHMQTWKAVTQTVDAHQRMRVRYWRGNPATATLGATPMLQAVEEHHARTGSRYMGRHIGIDEETSILIEFAPLMRTEGVDPDTRQEVGAHASR